MGRLKFRQRRAFKGTHLGQGKTGIKGVRSFTGQRRLYLQAKVCGFCRLFPFLPIVSARVCSVSVGDL